MSHTKDTMASNGNEATAHASNDVHDDRTQRSRIHPIVLPHTQTKLNDRDLCQYVE
jgi:hypothetical protein